MTMTGFAQEPVNRALQAISAPVATSSSVVQNQLLRTLLEHKTSFGIGTAIFGIPLLIFIGYATHQGDEVDLDDIDMDDEIRELLDELDPDELNSLKRQDLQDPGFQTFLEGRKQENLRDFDQALHYYRQAEKMGCRRAMTRLGELYLEGIVVGPDRALAITYLKMAAERKDETAIKLLQQCQFLQKEGS